MSKLTLTDLVSLANATTAVTNINANNALIETALENTLSRDGTSPNHMLTQLDMNSNKLINVGNAASNSDGVNLGDVTSLLASSAERATAALGLNRQVQYNNNGIFAGATNLTYSADGYLGVNTTTPGASASSSGYPFIPADGGLDVGGVILLHPEQRSIYVYGDFASTAYFASTAPDSWGWALGNIGNNNLGLLYTTHAFSIDPLYSSQTVLTTVWTPNWTYLQHAEETTGLTPAFNKGLAIGWNRLNIGEVNLIGKRSGVGNTSFVFSDLANDTTVNDLLYLRTAGYNLEISSWHVDDTPVLIKGFASQTGRLTDWKDSAGNILLTVSANGSITMGVSAGYNLGLGNAVPTGLFGDGANTAIRAYAGASKIYFQNQGGSTTFGDWDSTRLQVGTYIRYTNYTVAQLPAAATAGAGSLAFVTDANATTRLSIAAGGGANKLLVCSDGTNWLLV